MRVKPDAASILAGLVFVAIGLVYLLASGGHASVGARWTVSLLVLGLGLTAVVGLVTRRR
jgi:hypothetical protein